MGANKGIPKVKSSGISPTEFIESVNRVDRKDEYKAVQERLQNKRSARLLHGAIGLDTESGEIMDNLKRHIFYGTPINEQNMVEELGDILWYMGLMIDELGLTFEEVMAGNERKLRARFPEEFSETKAVERNTTIEMEALGHKNVSSS